MKHSLIAILAAGLVLAATSLTMAFDDIGQPPPDPVGTVYPEMTPELVQKKVEEQIRAQFEKAAGPSGYLIDAQQAQASGWGFVVDHFAQIDKNGDGSVSLSDISNFLSARTPQALMRAARQNLNQRSGTQIIE
ncbi:EF-hand domain-containing protein [Phyllobacterium sp. 21LDTY02-6]|jgi:hypothetical protein|uniref:EF-hand domain-containing protein n=1 Tax=unclassified Phyllobacterium TaxID=2638441 RepID=UPI0020210F34|nr:MULTISPECIES: EF-hand domain-containing protein [unclassified Phyllobacterium]MCO4316998.1 EF-hand domain-containing protein [Phyllobacterium sp. 21LDTY02-6]MCX8282410.1 EF-hand domain-containing protein [Phyllobacterium sp. 0TCS1.6C]MCX8295237.1 EF-hand domain-containing protein [Phyllobacterium sp. 0TCS1.6A]